jgi:hypothetical protein
MKSKEINMKQAASLVCYPTLKMEATYFFETWVAFQRATRRYIYMDRIVHEHSVSTNKGPSHGLSNTKWRFSRKLL